MLTSGGLLYKYVECKKYNTIIHTKQPQLKHVTNLTLVIYCTNTNAVQYDIIIR